VLIEGKGYILSLLSDIPDIGWLRGYWSEYPVLLAELESLEQVRFVPQSWVGPSGLFVYISGHVLL
jgi:hypothetical protein